MRRLSRRGTASPQRHIVLGRPEFSLEECTAAAEQCGAEVIHTIPLIHGLVCSCPGPATVAALAGHTAVSAMEPDLRLPLPRVWATGRILGRNQRLPWGIARIGVPKAWEKSRGTGVRVAVIDTGADWEHPDLYPNVRGGFNALRPGEAPADDNGHGTHVAGIIAATDNHDGMVGVAPGCELYVVKAFDQHGTGATADVLLALQWCADYSMQVVKMTGHKDNRRPLSRRPSCLVAAGRRCPRSPLPATAAGS